MTDVLAFFQALGFEHIEIEDNLTALSVEAADGSYALITDEEGTLPEQLREVLIFAVYSAEGAYQWSVGFKNAYLFQELWSKGETVDQQIALLQEYAVTKGAE